MKKILFIVHQPVEDNFDLDYNNCHNMVAVAEVDNANMDCSRNDVQQVIIAKDGDANLDNFPLRDTGHMAFDNNPKIANRRDSP